ncbi:MAG: glycosyltransferase [Candidatus Latescibacterota bacterium]
MRSWVWFSTHRSPLASNLLSEEGRAVRILHVDTAPTWRGGEAQVLGLAQGLALRGHEVWVVGQPNSPLVARVREAGVSARSVHMRGEWDLFGALRLAKVMRRFNPDILHTHTSHAHTLGLLAWYLSGCKAKLVVSRRVDFAISMHGLGWIKYGPSVGRFIAVSEGVRRVLIQGGVPESRTAVVRSGIDLMKFDDLKDAEAPYQEFGIQRDALLVGNVAALAPHKDQACLLDAARKVIDVFPRARFLVVGEGPLHEMLLDHRARLGLEREVIFTGFRKDIGAILGMLNVFVLSSYLEGLGTSVLDAMLMGLPVVGTTVGGIPEAVRDGENGFLVPPRNPKALSEAICRLLKDRSLRERFGRAGRIAVRRFDIRETVRQTTAIYADLLGGSG